MHSPQDSDNDAAMSSGTDSPPPEEVNPQPTSSSHFGSSFVNQIAQTLGGAKRRLPGGSSLGGPSATRDPKMRRKIEGKGGSSNLVAASSWDGSKEVKREERELVDHNLVEFLRKEIGDPFLDAAIHRQA